MGPDLLQIFQKEMVEILVKNIINVSKIRSFDKNNCFCIKIGSITTKNNFSII